MTKGKSIALAVLVLATAAALSMALPACGGGSDGDEGAALTGTAAERAGEILGHAPIGVANEIVDRGYTIVANDADYRPQSSVDEATGELIGFDVDVAKKVGQILGLEVRFKNPDWEAVPAGLDQGRYDASIGSMPRNEERDSVVDFSKPYYYAPGQVFVKEGGPQIAGVDDLAGRTVGVGVATTYYDFLKKHSTAVVKTYGTEADAFADLLNDDLDYVMAASLTGQKAIRAGRAIETSGTPLSYERLCFAVKNGEADWLALLDHAIATMREDGSLTAMSERWFDGADLTAMQ